MAQGAVGCKARRVLCGVCARLHAAPGFESAAICSCSHAAPGFDSTAICSCSHAAPGFDSTAICSCSHAAPGFESAAICSGRNSGFPHGPAPIRRLRRHLPPRAGEGEGIIFFLRGLRPRTPRVDPIIFCLSFRRALHWLCPCSDSGRSPPLNVSTQVRSFYFRSAFMGILLYSKSSFVKSPCFSAMPIYSIPPARPLYQMRQRSRDLS